MKGEYHRAQLACEVLAPWGTQQRHEDKKPNPSSLSPPLPMVLDLLDGIESDIARVHNVRHDPLQRGPETNVTRLAPT